MTDELDEKRALALDFLYRATRDPELVEVATGWRRNYSFYSDNPVSKSAQTVADTSRHFEPESIENITGMWSQLLELSSEDISNEIEVLEAQRRQEEQAVYPFNQRDGLFIDLDFWARASTWTDEQAVMLSLDRNPLPANVAFIEALSERQVQECEVAAQFFDRMALAQSAREAGQVSEIGKSIDFVRWFEQMDFESSPDLIAKVRYYQDGQGRQLPQKDDELMDREKRTLLKLVAAMAIRGYSYNPSSKRNQSTSDIKSDLDLLGFPLDDKTILKWLRVSTDLIDPSYWDDD